LITFLTARRAGFGFDFFVTSPDHGHQLQASWPDGKSRQE